MPPDTPSRGEGSSGLGHGRHKERIGNYIVGSEIGRGSFATVYKGYKSKSREPIAIKAVSRQKLTTKLLENLESEINILKAISHPNITALEDCFKNDTHIYLVMEYCSGSDLSVYIKNRGRLPTLDYVPHGSLDGEKVFYPHPPTGGIAERVTRSFLGQLAHALHFLREKNLIHRDIKPQNLLLQPAGETDLAAGHPLGIPLLKVADFGFARILPASAMAETLCGSPLYMAPEILRYEKYDAKVDLWSVGAVLFEMAVGKPPFRAANHVELLRKIEKGEDRIKFPDESSRQSSDPDSIPPLLVSADIKALIRGLLKRHAADRMSFEQFFGSSHVWDEHMSESHSTEEGSLSLDASTDSSATEEQSFKDARGSPDFGTRHIQPVATDPALNPQPARVRSDLEQRVLQNRPTSTEPPRISTDPRPQVRPPQPIRRSEPKYYVQDDSPTLPAVPAESPLSGPRPIQNPAHRSQRRLSGRESASVEEAQPITPGSNHPIPVYRPRGVGEGSPLAATPPITVNTTGKDESALEGDDSMVARDYVVIEKRTVEVNALADELDQASRQPSTALARRPSSRTSVVSRPISSFKPSEHPQAKAAAVQASARGNNPTAPMSYSPPFGLSSTPPFAIPPVTRQSSISHSPLTVTNRNPSSVNAFPPVQIYDSSPRYSSSPGSHQPGALARVLTNTARRVLGTTANVATHALARAASARRPAIIRTRQIDPEEDELLDRVEEQARFAFVLFEFGDERLTAWQQLSEAATPAGQSASRRQSNSSQSSQVDLLRQQELAAGQSCILFVKALSFIVRATRTIREFTERRNAAGDYQASQELNDMVQWLRARFNECFEKVEFAKARYAAEELPFIEKNILDRAREFSIAAANHEKAGDYPAAEIGYETSLWLVQTLLDEIMWDGQVKDEDRSAIEPWVTLIGGRLRDFRKKLEERKQTKDSFTSSPTSDVRPALAAFPRERTYSATVPSQADQTKMASPVSSPQMPSSAPTSGTTVVRSTYRPASTTYTPALLHPRGDTPT